MEAECERCEEESKKCKRMPLYSTPVRENASTPWKRESILVITDYSLDLYSPDTFELRKSIVWMKVTGVKQKEENVILKMSFSSVTLESFLYSQQVFETIIFVLLNLHTRKEIIEMDLSDFLNDMPKPTCIGILSRLLQMGVVWKEQSPLQIYTELKTLFIGQHSIIDLEKFLEPIRALNYIFDILPMCSFLKGLIIPDIPNEIVCDTLYEHTGRLKKLEFISIKGRARHFCKFMEKFVQKTNVMVSGLEFTDSRFKAKHMVSLSQYCDAKRITSLGFHNAFRKKTRMSFYTNFFTPNMMTSLSYLSLDYTPELDLVNIMPNVPKLVYFSVAYCDLLVEDILHTVQLPNIRILNVSGNKCERLPPTAIQLPKTLINLIAADVTWCDGALSNAFKVVSMRTELGLNVDFSNAKVSKTEFEQVFSDLQTTMNFPLLSLKWNGNRVDKRFFDYLKKNNALSSLSLDGVFSVSAKEIDYLCDFIQNTSSVKKLSIKGCDEYVLGGSAVKVINAVNNSYLEDLDISDNKIPDNGILAMKSLFRDDIALKQIAFDGCFPERSDAYISLIDIAAQNRQIQISFPINDFETMRASDMITEEVYDAAIAHFQFSSAVQYSKSRSVIHVPKQNPFNRPFHVFNKEEEKLPKYFTKFEAERLRRTKQSDFISIINSSNTSFSQISMDPPMYIKQSSPDGRRERKTFKEHMSEFASNYHNTPKTKITGSKSSFDRFSVEESNLGGAQKDQSAVSELNASALGVTNTSVIKDQNITPPPIEIIKPSSFFEVPSKRKITQSSMMEDDSDKDEDEELIPTGSPKKSRTSNAESAAQSLSLTPTQDIVNFKPQKEDKSRRRTTHRFVNDSSTSQSETQRHRGHDKTKDSQRVRDPLKELRMQRRNSVSSAYNNKRSTKPAQNSSTSSGESKPTTSTRKRREEKNKKSNPEMIQTGRFREINPAYLKFSEPPSPDTATFQHNQEKYSEKQTGEYSYQSSKQRSPKRSKRHAGSRLKKPENEPTMNEFASTSSFADERYESNRSRRSASERRTRARPHSKINDNNNNDSDSDLPVPPIFPSILYSSSTAASERPIETHRTYGSRIRRLLEN